MLQVHEDNGVEQLLTVKHSANKAHFESQWKIPKTTTITPSNQSQAFKKKRILSEHALKDVPAPLTLSGFQSRETETADKKKAVNFRQLKRTSKFN
mmetsp:Transcript_5498/g.8609  ORF Transcript_5498/g.8609 Transcript_5498/m.8609 type:complete len:96 (+) Transcript_5498:1742-2029(+)